jgi:hypothetical protein
VDSAKCAAFTYWLGSSWDCHFTPMTRASMSTFVSARIGGNVLPEVEMCFRGAKAIHDLNNLIASA